ncbi:MAG: D-alanyl-D-alanine carboxypeptidase/D-alanyl-D-alanine-endopeptidase [Bacteroidota bacterium]
MKRATYILCSGLLMIASSCSMQKRISKEAKKDILAVADFAPAHVGISLYDPATQQYLYNYQADKFFVPASNTKLFTCYAAMKYLGDSLVALRYVDKGEGTIEVEANGDPSFLHPDFKNQRVYDFLQKQKRILLTDDNWKDNALGAGWAWDDFNSDYMAERSVMPVYGNVVHFTNLGSFKAMPSYFQKPFTETAVTAKGNFTVRREFGTNQFTIKPSNAKFSSADIPFYTPDKQLLFQLLNDTLKTKVESVHFKIDRLADVVKLYSQPTDSLLKIMMHRSDNFYAEQSLLMVSNDRLGYMSTARIIDTLLKTDLSDLPQKPKWVDGSGLSRYNLFSPQDFVGILTKMKNEFSWNRITTILETGGSGTISNYYKNYAGHIYAKTGSLSNHIALSGYLITKKGKQLIFSVLVNAHQAPVANIRKGVEKFLTAVIEKY